MTRNLGGEAGRARPTQARSNRQDCTSIVGVLAMTAVTAAVPVSTAHIARGRSQHAAFKSP
ncbi:hypothetical protein [Lysobacter gummosus]|uniref:hypothetical protein n=1 Tax=Lysobacter gummosus TaxID=262324 RepID=UPI00363E30E6